MGTFPLGDGAVREGKGHQRLGDAAGHIVPCGAGRGAPVDAR